MPTTVCEQLGISSSCPLVWPAGKARAIGVSHATAADLEALRETATMWPPSVNQCELSVIHHDDDAIAYCAKHGITYQSFSPLWCGPQAGEADSKLSLSQIDSAIYTALL
eukprot:SAG31_NODE_3665_length_4008_cov_1.196726_1_plen_110_part_00